jgi:hypothetical protein
MAIALILAASGSAEEMVAAVNSARVACMSSGAIWILLPDRIRPRIQATLK